MIKQKVVKRSDCIFDQDLVQEAYDSDAFKGVVHEADDAVDALALDDDPPEVDEEVDDSLDNNSILDTPYNTGDYTSEQCNKAIIEDIIEDNDNDVCIDDIGKHCDDIEQNIILNMAIRNNVTLLTNVRHKLPFHRSLAAFLGFSH